MTAEEKRKAEMATVKKMLEIYCRAHHGNNLSLCEECEALFDYARARVERCPHMETKTFCSACQTHCYAPKMREKIREALQRPAHAAPRARHGASSHVHRVAREAALKAGLAKDFLQRMCIFLYIRCVILFAKGGETGLKDVLLHICRTYGL